MLFGAHPARIIAVQPVQIHGTRMLDVVYQLDGETTPRSARLGAEALPETLNVDDRVFVHLLMNVATRIDPATS
jgi:hypothetical protein